MARQEKIAPQQFGGNKYDNDYEPPQGIFEKTLSGIDDLWGVAEKNPAEWSIAKSCVFFALGIYTMERCYHIILNL